MTDEKGLQVVDAEYKMVNIEDFALSLESIKGRIRMIHEVMKATMKEGTHYGTIPGCDKPTLYKPGAELLSMMFRLTPKYEIRRTDLPDGNREYEVITTILHSPSGMIVGQGVGSCSSMESKYHFRDGEPISTGKPVPKEYWKSKDKKLIGGKGYRPMKDPDTDLWVIGKVQGKIINDNPANEFNTILKMAKKRSHIDAILTTTAASDIFDQDIEDIVENDEDALQDKGEKPEDMMMSKDQRRKLWNMMEKAGLSKKESAEFFAFVYHGEQPTKKQASDFIESFETKLNEFQEATTPTREPGE